MTIESNVLQQWLETSRYAFSVNVLHTSLRHHMNPSLCQVGVKVSEAQMAPANVKLHSWGTYNEDVLSSDTDSEITVIGLLEQLNITRDTSDYLWYTTR